MNCGDPVELPKKKKRINTRAKGKLLEKRARLILESEGWLVETANPKLMFIGPGKVLSKSHDFFGRWDIIAVRPSVVKFIQVSTWEEKSGKIKQVADFPMVGQQEIWLWFSRGKNSHFRILDEAHDWDWKGECKMKVAQ